MKWNPAGSTPTTVAGVPFMMIVLPTASGAPSEIAAARRRGSP